GSERCTMQFRELLSNRANTRVLVAAPTLFVGDRLLTFGQSNAILPARPVIAMCCYSRAHGSVDFGSHCVPARHHRCTPFTDVAIAVITPSRRCLKVYQ